MKEKNRNGHLSNGKHTNAKPEADEEKQKMLKNEATNGMMGDHFQNITLRDITFTLPKGKLLGVCGSVGSGKSSLVQAILGRVS